MAEEPEVRQSLPAGEEEQIQFSGVKLRMVRFTSIYETNRLLSAADSIGHRMIPLRPTQAALAVLALSEFAKGAQYLP